VQKFPEKYFYEMIPEMAEQPHHQYLPVYFGNVCLRFLPVLKSTLLFSVTDFGLICVEEEMLESA